MTTHTTRMLIIGSGPAGLSAAIYGARAGMQPIVVQGLQPGGQLTITTDVENYPGFRDVIQGPWLMQEMQAQAEHVGTRMLWDTITEVDLTSSPFRAIGDSGDVYEGDTLVIATGAQAKWLGAPGEQELSGKGVSACATCDGFFYRGKKVVVIGGGNIFRGMAGAAKGMDRAQADYMGMLATVMNALAMQNALEQLGVPTRVQSAIEMDKVCEPVIRRRAERHMEKGRVVIFAAGVGAPYFTTDSGAALRAAEMQCDALLKGTSVDGVYDSDPKSNPNAKRYDTVDYDTVLAKNLKVMDASAVALCRDNNIPIVVFSIREKGNLARVLAGVGTQTIVKKD